MRILAIDDDLFILDIVRLMLSGEHEIISVPSAIEGLNKLRKLGAPIDLILLDWMMPGIDGLSLLISLKSDPILSDIPVVFLSGKTDSQDIRSALDAGAAGYITKPFRKAELVCRIDAIGPSPYLDLEDTPPPQES
jgi:CheY-like chemotaxis protein